MIVKANETENLVALGELMMGGEYLHLYTPAFIVESGDATLDVDKESPSKYFTTVMGAVVDMIENRHGEVVSDIINGDKVAVIVEFRIPEFNSHKERQLDSELLVYHPLVNEPLLSMFGKHAGGTVFMPIAFLEQQPVVINGIHINDLKVNDIDSNGKATNFSIKYDITRSCGGDVAECTLDTELE